MTSTHHDSGVRPGFMTTDEVLEYLKVNSRTIYRLIRSGSLPAVRVGRQWRFRQSDLEAWLEERRSTQAAGARRVPADRRTSRDGAD